jgi:hypothetical protein
MQSLRTTILLMLLSAFAVGSLMAQKVNTDYDKKADFSHYKTYTWVREPNIQNPLMRQRVKDDIDTQLTAKGWQLVPDNADVAISAKGATKDQQTLEAFYNGCPGWRWSWGTTAMTTVEHYTIGTLVVDIFDTKTKQAIFRGTASDTLSDKPEKNDEKINKVIGRMFKNFPPNPKG